MKELIAKRDALYVAFMDDANRALPFGDRYGLLCWAAGEKHPAYLEWKAVIREINQLNKGKYAPISVEWL